MKSAPVTVWVWSSGLASVPQAPSLTQLFQKECERPQHCPRMVVCLESQDREIEAGRSGVEGQPQTHTEFWDVIKVRRLCLSNTCELLGSTFITELEPKTPKQRKQAPLRCPGSYVDQRTMKRRCDHAICLGEAVQTVWRELTLRWLCYLCVGC